MQPVERKRQGYIHELIETEERYVDDLQLVVEVRALGSAAPYGVGACTGVSPLTVESPAATGTLTPSERFLCLLEGP